MRGAVKLLSKRELKELLPVHIFEKSLFKSLAYWLIDLTAISLLLICFYRFNPQGIYYLIWANLLGLYMWCTFMIGHDAGHGSFSYYSKLNFIVGLLSHGPLLVPFRQWQKSHEAHHSGHSHKTKDTSHVHLTLSNEQSYFWTRVSPVCVPLMYGVFYLLCGQTDGIHFTIDYYATKRSEKIGNILSIASVFAFLCFYIVILKNDFWKVFFLPWLIYNSWVYTVTFLQHHHDNMIIYDKESWTFMKGAMETIDRTYGFGLDSITHNITNGHLVHHVFFTQIPHYNLIEARNIIKPFLGDWYKVEDQNWLLEFLRDHFVLTRRAVFENGVDYVYKRAFSSWSEVNEFLGFSKKFN